MSSGRRLKWELFLHQIVNSDAFNNKDTEPEMLNTVKLFIHIFKLRKKYYYIFSQFHSIFSTVFVDKNAAVLLSFIIIFFFGDN